MSFNYSYLVCVLFFVIVVLICIALTTNDIEHLSCAYYRVMYYPGELSTQVFCLFFNWMFLKNIELYVFFIFSWYKFSIRYIVFK